MTQLLDGRLALTTPEGIRLHLTPAGPTARLLAWGIDLLLFCVVVWLLAVLNFSRLGSGLFMLALFLLYWGYPVVCEVLAGGATIGKRVVGLEVVQDGGLPVGWRASVLRNLLLVADFLPFFYAAGLASMLWDAHFRRLGDLAAGTLVVYRERAPQRPAPVDLAPLSLPFALPPAQQRCLLDLLERERALPLDRLEELGTIAEPLTGSTGAESLLRLRRMAAGLRQ
jgi:uncharacterized RDD family membrane protein YckC